MAKAISSPTILIAALVRSLSGPRASKAAAPHASMLSRPSCGSPTKVRTIVSGSTCASSLTASNESRPTSAAIKASAAAWIWPRTSFMAPGPRGAPMASRKASWAGGSLAMIVPRMPPLAGMLAPGPPAEENSA